MTRARTWRAISGTLGREHVAHHRGARAGLLGHREPPGTRLRSLDLLAGIPRRTVWYRRLGLDRAKPTDLFGVFPPGLELPPCRNGHSDYIAAPRGSRTGTQGGVSTEEAGRIPRQLAERFRVALEQQWQAAAA